jgi:hypothetical protein
MVSSRSAVFYTEQNIGPSFVRSASGVTYSFTNSGINSVASKSGVTYAVENVGFPPPIRIIINQPQIGWGVPITPSKDVTLNRDSAKAVAYVYEGDVTT